MTNKNRLLKEYPGATGIKTGYTSKAGRCLVFSAERDGMELVGVVLNCGEWFDAAQRMLDWGFDTFKPVEVMQSGIQPLKAGVKGGKTGQVAVRAREGITIPVKVGDRSGGSGDRLLGVLCLSVQGIPPAGGGQVLTVIRFFRGVAQELGAAPRILSGHQSLMGTT